MVSLNYHGGQCCGINHLYGFITVSHLMDDYAKKAEEHLTTLKNKNTKNSLIVEVVLTDDQLTANDNYWLKWLKKHRFRRVTRMRNPNSGNAINIFHWRTLEESIKDGLKSTDPWKSFKE